MSETDNQEITADDLLEQRAPDPMADLAAMQKRLDELTALNAAQAQAAQKLQEQNEKLFDMMQEQKAPKKETQRRRRPSYYDEDDDEDEVQTRKAKANTPTQDDTQAKFAELALQQKITDFFEENAEAIREFDRIDPQSSQALRMAFDSNPAAGLNLLKGKLKQIEAAKARKRPAPSPSVGNPREMHGQPEAPPQETPAQRQVIDGFLPEDQTLAAIQAQAEAFMKRQRDTW